MKQVTDIQQVKADLAMSYATRLALLNTMLEKMARLYHSYAHKSLFHRPELEECWHKECEDICHLIENTRQMLSQGV